MASLIFRQEAIHDLNSIWNYTFEKWSEKQADKYYSLIKFTCKGIAENPEIGVDYSEIQKNLFGCKSGKHIIFYQVISEHEIEVIRILHEMMDLENRLRED